MSDRNLLLQEGDIFENKINDIDDIDLTKKSIEEIINYYVQNGYVITVEQRPLDPLAMGNYEHAVSVRRKIRR